MRCRFADRLYPILLCWPALLLLCLPAAAVEKAAYDSNGRMIALLSTAEDQDVVTNLVAVLPSGKRVPLQARRDRRGMMRKGRELAWSAPLCAGGGSGRLRPRRPVRAARPAPDCHDRGRTTG